ncbi:hypothetical protein [Mycobacterium intermedium]|uniref:hypothetical protein n=1 Tax=Mycobacterium intermedium TaxID=28445 RepID=UPI0039C16717
MALGVAACSSTVAPPAAGPTTSAANSTAKAAPAPVVPVTPTATRTNPLAKDWKVYGGTVYYGCPERFTLGGSALDTIRPKVFDTKSGELVSPAVPVAPAGVQITGAACALTGTTDNAKVAYLVTTLTHAQPDVTKTIAYVFDLNSNQPLVTKELQPPNPDVRLAAPKNWGFAGTASGVLWTNAFAGSPRTVVLSNTDLATMWDDPQSGQAWQDVISFQRNTEGRTAGAELRLPSGDAIHQDNDIWTVDEELSDGPDRLVKITRRDGSNPPVISTVFYDLNSRSIIRFGDADRISGGGLTATLVDGQLFIDGHNSGTSDFGFGVWNLRTQHWDLQMNRDEAKQLAITKVAYFAGHLYLTSEGGKYSTIVLPDTAPVRSSWAVRPFGRISGWTLVCQGETAEPAKGECQQIVLVKDQDGHYPGPWT